MYIAAIIVFIYWLWCYYSFRQEYRYYKIVLFVTTEDAKKDPSPKNRLEYASALMLCQRYSDALNIFEELDAEGLSKKYDFIPLNITFCKKPHPLMSRQKNLNGSYWHNFFLVRLGARRQVYITEETQLKLNAVMRQMGRQ